MTDTTHRTGAGEGRQVSAPDLPVSWGWLVGLGALSAFAGAFAIFNPFLASLAVEAVAAAAFLVVGVSTLWMALTRRPEGARNRVLNGVIGALMIAFALSLLLMPVSGLVSLTLIVAVFFLAEGIVRLAVAFRMRDRAGWQWLAGGGAVSVALGLLILVVLPGAALSLLGFLLGLDLLATGLGMVAMGLACRTG